MGAGEWKKTEGNGGRRWAVNSDFSLGEIEKNFHKESELFVQGFGFLQVGELNAKFSKIPNLKS